MSRPDDERFTSLLDMRDHFDYTRSHSRAVVAPSRRISATTVEGDRKGLAIVGPGGNQYFPTHWAFGQLAARAEAPAGYLRTLPPAIAADCINYGLQFKRDIEDVGILLYKDGDAQVKAVTGPSYGRIWCADIVAHLIARFGDGVTGDWKVPGEFGQHVAVTKGNTTLFASDRDMFVFLCDEQHRIDVPNRRDGRSGSLARGFFVWNSEVGSATFGLATFLFDYVCCNRIVWGAEDVKQVTIRHTSSAPDKFLDEMRPALESYANSSARSVTEAIATARSRRLSGEDGSLDKFLNARFSRRQSEAIKLAGQSAEGRPIENVWDATCAITEYARGIKWQDERVALERVAGDLLTAASK